MPANLLGLVNASVTVVESESTLLRCAVVGWMDDPPCVDVLCLVRSGPRAGEVIRAPLSSITVDVAGGGLVG